MAFGDYSERQQMLDAIRNRTPEQEDALVQSAALPERISEFKRSRDAEEGRLQNQINSAQQLAFSPMSMTTNSTPAAVASIVSNVLRTFGGLALAGGAEHKLNDAQAESARQYGDLMKLHDSATRAGIDTQRQGLEQSLIPELLRRYPSNGYGGGQQ